MRQQGKILIVPPKLLFQSSCRSLVAHISGTFKSFTAERGMTQNANECLHSVIWSVVPKEQFHSNTEVELGICLGVLLFNQGWTRSNRKIFEELDMSIGKRSLVAWSKIDQKRLYKADHALKDEVKTQRKRYRSKKLKKQDTFEKAEGVSYSAGSF